MKFESKYTIRLTKTAVAQGGAALGFYVVHGLQFLAVVNVFASTIDYSRFAKIFQLFFFLAYFQ